MIPDCIVSFIQNILFFSTLWSAKAVQNFSIAFCETRITIQCNSRIVSNHFSCTIIDHFIISFGIIVIASGYTVDKVKAATESALIIPPYYPWAVNLIKPLIG